MHGNRDPTAVDSTGFSQPSADAEMEALALQWKNLGTLQSQSPSMLVTQPRNDTSSLEYNPCDKNLTTLQDVQIVTVTFPKEIHKMQLIK